MINNDINEICNILADKIEKGNAIAFLGAAVSKEYKDQRTGKVYKGIKTANEIVKDLKSKKHYIKEDMGFEKAFFSIKYNEGRNELERILCEYTNIPIDPLPAHNLLAELDFSTYMTTNFDCLMEKALDNYSKEYSVIIEDYDVSTWQIKRKIPIIKLHGCTTRPSTIIAAEDEYKMLGGSNPIFASLINVLLTNKVILFCGFSLADEDFKMTFRELKAILGDNMPRSYAIVKNITEYERIYWKSQNVTLIDEDLTCFLKQLRRIYIKNKHYDNSSWTGNAYLDKITQYKTSPTETQAINAFLNGLMEEIKNPRLSIGNILENAEHVICDIKKNKRMFLSMRKMWEEIEKKLKSVPKENIDDVEQIVEDIIQQRTLDAENLSKKYKGIIKRGQNILLYSQSIRVMDLLKKVSSRVQEECTIYICECRPKSANPFQDAIDIVNYLCDTRYTKIIIPDAVMGNLMAQHLIDIVIMGAHTLYYDKNEFVSFVNTCGTNMILNSAQLYDIPVYIIAEQSKRQDLDINPMEDIVYDEERNTFNNSLINMGIRIETEILNIRYDLCRATENIQLLTDN